MNKNVKAYVCFNCKKMVTFSELRAHQKNGCPKDEVVEPVEKVEKPKRKRRKKKVEKIEGEVVDV